MVPLMAAASTDRGNLRDETSSTVHRACEAMGKPPDPVPAPSSLPVPSSDEHIRACGGHQSLEDLKIFSLPRRQDGSVVDWAAPILEAWDCSEEAALNLLETFVTEGKLHGFSDQYSAS